MVDELRNIEPNLVFKYFQEICMIPRCSGNEQRISDYLVEFAEKHNLEVHQDKALNVIIKKPAYKGYENAPTVILQGHMDMVCEKNKDTVHNFDTDPIKLQIDGDMLKGQGTTIGADNGIAVAYCLALLSANDIPHPPLEVLITSEEETGMGGASNVDPKALDGKILINLDSEEEGTFLVSCAGGVRIKVHIPIEWQKADSNLLTYAIKIRGLKGGHSGAEIDKGRGNANKIMGRILSSLRSEINFYLSEINGGAKMNAIPRENDVIILIDGNDKENLEINIRQWNKVLKNEFKVADPGINVELDHNNSKISRVFSKKTLDKVINALVLIPNGIQTMSMEIEGLVQSSTNIGVVTTFEDKVTFESAIRSSIRSLKEDIVNQTKVLAESLEIEMTRESDYPEWQYNPDSYIRGVFEKVYENEYGKKPEIAAIHAGLECGLFKEILGDIDMISLGPDMYDVHTPDERISISSTTKVWNFLIAALKEIK